MSGAGRVWKECKWKFPLGHSRQSLSEWPCKKKTPHSTMMYRQINALFELSCLMLFEWPFCASQRSEKMTNRQTWLAPSFTLESIILADFMKPQETIKQMHLHFRQSTISHISLLQNIYASGLNCCRCDLLNANYSSICKIMAYLGETSRLMEQIGTWCRWSSCV